MNSTQNSNQTMSAVKPQQWLRSFKRATAAAVLTATLGIAGTALAAVVSDYSIIRGDSSIQIGDVRPVWTQTFNTGGRSTSDAYLRLDVAHLTSTYTSVEVRVNNTVVGYIHPYPGEASGNWYSQTITFSGSVLNDGNNELEIRGVSWPGANYGDIYDDFYLKSVICHFKQSV